MLSANTINKIYELYVELLKVFPAILAAFLVPFLTYKYAINQNKKKFILENKHKSYYNLLNAHCEYQSNLASMLGTLMHAKNNKCTTSLDESYKHYQEGFEKYRGIVKQKAYTYIYANQKVIKSDERISRLIIEFNDTYQKSIKTITKDISKLTDELYEKIYNDSNKIINEAAYMMTLIREDIGIKETLPNH